MDFLKGKTIIYRENDEVLAEEALTSKALILYYFTAGHCDACRSFDQQLKEVYIESLCRDIELAVVIVSDDPNKESFTETLKTYYDEWFAIPFDDELSQVLKYNYGVTCLPSLVVVRKNGEVVTREGRVDIERIGVNVLVTWAE